MTTTTERPVVPPPAHRRRWPAVLGLVVALAAAAVLLLLPDRNPPAPAGPVSPADAWPGAQRAEIPGNVPDGPVFQPGVFLDARTVIGTAPSPDGGSLRLLLRRADGGLRELRRRPIAENPVFDHMAAAGSDVVWTESSDTTKVQIWTADPDSGPARRLTTDTGDATFYGSQYDLVPAQGRVHWTAAAGAGKVTEVRSVALTGGAVTVREEPGVWALTAWPWLTNGAGDQTGTSILRDLTSNTEKRVSATGTELATCSPAWCRVMVMSAAGLVRIDVMRPDGSARARIAGSNASAAITDVAVLDRFEILAESGPGSDLTGTAALRIYDIAQARTVDVSSAVSGAFSRNGVLWWATGDQDSIVWHTLDLRTV